MPIYEYLCKACNEKFSVLQRVSEGEKDTVCPKCSSGQVRKVMSSFCCSTSDYGMSSSYSSHGGGGG